KAVHAALRLHHEMALVEALALDEQIRRWGRKAREDVRGKHSRAEAALFAPGRPKAGAVETLLADCAADVRVLLKQLQALRDAYQVHAQAKLFLPAYAPYLEKDPADLVPWNEAIDATLALQAVLAQPPSKADERLDEPVRTMTRLTEDLRGNLEKLRRPLAPDRLKRFVNDVERTGPDGLLQMQALLEVPWLKAAERASM